MVAITSDTLHLPTPTKADSEKNLVITMDLHLPNLQLGDSPPQQIGNLRKQNTPTVSPKENIAAMWHEIHGSHNWHGLLDPLHPWVRREIIKYGEFAQATYDAFDFDPYSKYCGSCRYSPQNLFEKLDLCKNGYLVSKYIYAMSTVDLPVWLTRSLLGDTWSKDSNWMGYVAVSDDTESHRIGRRDILVAWRGTKTPSEWSKNVQYKLVPMGDEGHGDEKVMVEEGFLDIYKSKSDSTRYNKSSVSEQVMREVKRLVSLCQQRGEQVSLTITGHSLGGALALLCAHEAKSSFPDIPISVISFGAPRVGNTFFRDELNKMQVKTLRVVNKQDAVPKVPGVLFNEKLRMFEKITGKLKGVYWHVGVKLKLDIEASPYLKHEIKLSGFHSLETYLSGFHSLETYLHLVDGFSSTKTSFRSNSRRDVALVNKGSNMLVDELKVPEFWYQLANKGLVCNSYGRWAQPSRDQDIPSPTRVERSYYP